LYVPLFSPYVLLVLPISCNITLGNTKIRNINFFQETKISIALQQWVLRNTLGSMFRHGSWNVSWLAHWLRAVWKVDLIWDRMNEWMNETSVTVL
jgi:hypothetical protein